MAERHSKVAGANYEWQAFLRQLADFGWPMPHYYFGCRHWFVPMIGQGHLFCVTDCCQLVLPQETSSLNFAFLHVGINGVRCSDTVLELEITHLSMFQGFSCFVIAAYQKPRSRFVVVISCMNVELASWPSQ